MMTTDIIYDASIKPNETKIDIKLTMYYNATMNDA